jgi:hypothetical protein
MLTTQAREIIRCVWFGGHHGTDGLIFFLPVFGREIWDEVVHYRKMFGQYLGRAGWS